LRNGAQRSAGHCEERRRAAISGQSRLAKPLSSQ
jgi:hypothetical protein